MYKVKVQLKGIVPLAMDKLDPEQILNPPSHPARPTEEQLQEIAERAIYRNGSGLYLPRRAIKKCLLDGSDKANLKVGRIKLSKFLEATLFIEEREPLFNVKAPDAYEQFVMRRKDGNCIIKRRPLLNAGWLLAFTIAVDSARDSEQIKEALETGGTLIGLGNGRPEYGRFIVTKWEVIKDGKRN
jgi:hypothetical protein